MTWFGWALIAFETVTTILAVTAVGKQRRPLTAGNAAVVLVLAALIVVGALLVGTGHVHVVAGGAWN